jgi:LysM repeat protein
MLPRSLSRWLAPLALLACMVAVLVVVSGATKDDGGESGSEPTSEERQEARTGETGTSGRTQTGTRTSTGTQRRTYTVRPGDTLALISERTGVPVEELEELNPRIDPNSLTVGQKIKLTE